jgi:serine phosphatase RsbU (regulator of sigma subunit)
MDARFRRARSAAIFYTYLNLSDGRVAIAIGDISGKGVAAALLMALTSLTLESRARLLANPSEMLQTMHLALRQRLQANQMNAAVLITVFDPEGRSVTIANAGMIAPLLLACRGDGQGQCRFLDVGGLPIGTCINGLYRDVSVELAPGETLLFLSDGIVEAHNAEGELFGFERLEQLVKTFTPGMEVQEIVQRIIRAVLIFAGSAEPHDDVTIIAMRLPLHPSTASAGAPATPYATGTDV